VERIICNIKSGTAPPVVLYEKARRYGYKGA